MYQLLVDDSGTTAVEYGLISGMIAAVMIVGMEIFGMALSEMVMDIKDNLVAPTPL